jgi:hypothetical protein
MSANTGVSRWSHAERLQRLLEAVAMNSEIRGHLAGKHACAEEIDHEYEADLLHARNLAMSELSRAFVLYGELEAIVGHPDFFVFGEDVRIRIHSCLARIDERLRCPECRS